MWYKRGVETKVIGKRLGEQDKHMVYKAELTGLILAMKIAVEEGLKGTINIGLDNQVVIKTLQDRYTRFAQKMWRELQNLIVAFLERNIVNKIVVQWVPGHEGVEGNERADKKVRESGR